jgi:3D-(3,5/4)-trihydroxycyclohexane-1,2-dione acylhydrolase (decyclizing)
VPEGGQRSTIDFAAHAASLGAHAEHVKNVMELKEAMRRARAATTSQVIVIDTTPERTTEDGGAWWEVAIPEVSGRAEVREARQRYVDSKQTQRRK